MLAGKMYDGVAHNGAKVEYEKRAIRATDDKSRGFITMIYRSFHVLALIAPVLFSVTAVQAAPTEQNDYDAGKTPAQLFESDCGICHKSPAGLSKAPGMALESFLSEHYTASREAAAILAKYLQGVDMGQKEAPSARRPKAGAKPKSAKESKASDAKPADAKSSETKPSETKPSDAKPDEAKDEKKSTEAKKSEPKAGEAVSSDTKPKEKPKADADKSGKSD